MRDAVGSSQTVLVARAVTAAPAPVLTVGGAMKSGPQPVTPGDRLAVVAARMLRAGAGALAVVAGGRLVGMIADGDILRAVADGISTDMATVSDYMGPVACVVGLGTPASDAARRMIEQRARHIPVVRDGQVVGVISASDLRAAGVLPADQPR